MSNLCTELVFWPNLKVFGRYLRRVLRDFHEIWYSYVSDQKLAGMQNLKTGEPNPGDFSPGVKSENWQPEMAFLETNSHVTFDMRRSSYVKL